MYITYVDTQTPSEDGINIYHDHPAKRNLQLAGESKTDTKDSSSYHCVGPSSSKEAGATGTGAPKKHHYQEVHWGIDMKFIIQRGNSKLKLLQRMRLQSPEKRE